MTRRWAVGLVLVLAGVAVLLTARLPRIPQDPAYHRMADTRHGLGIPNAANVLSNVPFVLVGLAGLRSLTRPARRERAVFREPRERWPYALFFAALALTGLGSAFYHWAPDSRRLLWDRLPLGVAVVSLLAATVGERIATRAGVGLLLPLAAVAVWSVVHWHMGEMRGQGDLRWYGLVQFFPVLAVPLLLLLLPARYTRGGELLAAAALYAGAKGLEALDGAVLAVGGIVSGHTLKHLLAAAAGWRIVRMLVARHPTTPGRSA